MSDLEGTVNDDDDLTKAINDAYSGSGVKEEKEEAAEENKEAADNAQLPEDAQPGENWKKPMLEVYSDFTKWIDNWHEVMKYRRREGVTDLRYRWYKSGKDISILDRDQYRKLLFDTTEIQNKYKKYLDGLDGVNGDPIGMKFQAGNIMADERAFYIRHATIPRLMANGLLQNMQYDFLKEIYLTYIKKLREYEDDNYKALHENRYQGDASGQRKPYGYDLTK